MGRGAAAAALSHTRRCTSNTSDASSSPLADQDEQIPNLRSVAQDAQRRRNDALGLSGVDPKSAEQVHAAGRRIRSKRTYDDIVAAVLDETLKDMDQGAASPTTDQVYKRTQERLYEEEFGHKPTSSSDFQVKYLPFGPDFSLNRLEQPTYDENDPWPERSVTPENPVYNLHMVEDVADGGRSAEANKAANDAAAQRMYMPRKGFPPLAEFSDAVDELGHWEMACIAFATAVPLWQRRTLPLLHEHYRNMAHRVIRAERRFTQCRNAALAPAQASSAAFAATEEWIARVRRLLQEIHKSLAAPAYDPLKMKRSALGRYMRMSAEEMEAFKAKEKQRRNALIAEFGKEED